MELSTGRFPPRGDSVHQPAPGIWGQEKITLQETAMWEGMVAVGSEALPDRILKKVK